MASNPERLFLDNLKVIDDIVAFLAFRHHLNAEEREELNAGVRLKLIDDNYAVLRKFAGHSTLKTYLTAVIHRYFLDRRIEQWGKWRPGIATRRNGPTAVLLDRLISRDGLSFEEAVETLRTNHGVSESREALERLCELVPQRAPRRFVGEERLADVPAECPMEDALIRKMDRAAHAAALERALEAALAQCEPDDRLLLKLRFQDGLQIARIARLLGVEQKPLYRRLERIIATLRAELESRGIDRAWIDDFFAESSAKSPAASVSIMRGAGSRTQGGGSPDHA